MSFLFFLLLCTAARMTLTAGTKFGPCEIVPPLGDDGMGEVYCTRDNRLDRTVAIKICSSVFFYSTIVLE
jgi:hypothetical protein